MFRSGVPAAGIEYYLPLFFESVATIFDYLPRGASVALHGPVSDAVNDFWRDATSRYRLSGGDPDRPLLAPPQLFVPAEEFFVRLKDFPRIDISAAEQEQEKEQPVRSGALPDVGATAARRSARRAQLFVDRLGPAVYGRSNLPSAARPGDLLPRVWAAACPDCRFQSFLATELFCAGCLPVSLCFGAPDDGWAIVTEAELTPAWCAGCARARRSSLCEFCCETSELQVGDPVVHEATASAAKGLVSLDIGDGQTDFCSNTRAATSCTSRSRSSA